MTVERILRAKGSDVVTVTPDTTLEAAAKLLSDKRIGAVVVSRDGSEVEGILSERDIVRAIARLGRKALTTEVSETMTSDVVTCHLDDREADLMAVMTNRRVRHLPVIEDGAMVGMISIGDVVKSRIEEVEFEAQSLREYITGR